MAVVTYHGSIRQREVDRQAMWVFAFAAAAGLILSAIVHGTAFAGGNTLSGADYLLGIGVIVIMFPLVMALKREAPASRAMFPVGTPNILKYLGFLLIAYAIFNFFWCPTVFPCI